MIGEDSPELTGKAAVIYCKTLFKQLTNKYIRGEPVAA